MKYLRQDDVLPYKQFPYLEFPKSNFSITRVPRTHNPS